MQLGAWSHMATAQNNRIILDDSNLQMLLDNSAQYLRTDASKQLSDIVQGGLDWQSSYSVTPLGSDEALWFKLAFSYQRIESARYTFVIGNPMLDMVDIYVMDSLGRIKHSAIIGANRPYSNRPINFRDFALPFELDYGEEFEIYVRIQDTGPTAFDIQFIKSTEIIKKATSELTFIGAYSGALSILTIYFFVTYFMLHSPIRFWFALTNLAFLAIFLNIQGILSMLTQQAQYMASITLAVLAMVLFSTAKISHSLLVGLPKAFQFVNYGFAAAFLFLAIIPNAYWQIVVAALVGSSAMLFQLGCTIAYRNPFNSLPNRIFVLGMSAIAATNIFHIGIFLSGTLLGSGGDLLLSLLLLLGVLMIAVALEAHEKVLIHKEYEQQQTTIKDLQRFYDFFNNSAEGLFSSTHDGQLISVNPAMCTLFGYDNEEQMLEEIKNAAEFYANREDRDVLVGQLLSEGKAVNKEVKGIRRDGNEFWFAISVQLRDEEGSKLLFGSIVDITDRKQSDISLKYMATHDSLTGVYNRRHFESNLSEVLSKRHEPDFSLTLLYLDLDQFKTVNDSCGHKAGDVLIKELSRQLNDVVSSKGMLGRMGGDEFAVMLDGDNSVLGFNVANQLLKTVRDYRFIWDNRMFTLGVSIGMVEFTDKLLTAEQLMSMADSACYLAKEQGRNQIHIYSTEDAKMQKYEADLDSISLINEALEDNRFVLFYQHYLPLQEMKQGHHYELLLRIEKEDGSLIPPASFLPAAERYNLSAKIDKWVLENYLKWLSENPEHLASLEQANINLSGLSLADKDMKLFFLNAFEKHAIPYHKVCFEITESMAIVKMEETLEFIKTFHNLGCKFALDDFGIGFSSYEHLKKLPVDYVKIDGSFVKDILVDPIDMAMVCSMKDVAKAMGISTVAEYVETKEIMSELGKIGVDYAQGYGVAKPNDLRQFIAYLAIENQSN